MAFSDFKLIVSRNVTDDIFDHKYSVDEMMDMVVRKFNDDLRSGKLTSEDSYYPNLNDLEYIECTEQELYELGDPNTVENGLHWRDAFTKWDLGFPD